MKCQGYIYLIIDHLTNKKYIGQKIGVPENTSFYYGSGSIISNIIKKRGKIHLEKIILGSCSSIEELNLAEETCIDFFDSTNPIYGYNILKGGLNRVGYKHSDEAKEKIRVSSTGRLHTEESKQKMSLIQKEVSQRPEVKEQKRKNNLGPNNPAFGKKMSDEQRKKISEATKGKKKSPRSAEHQHNLSESLKGKIPWNKGLKIKNRPKYLIQTEKSYATRSKLP